MERHFQNSPNCFSGAKPDLLNLQRRLQSDVSAIMPQMMKQDYSSNLVNSFFGEPTARNTRKSPICSTCGMVASKRDLIKHFQSNKNRCNESSLVVQDSILVSHKYKTARGNPFLFPQTCLSKIKSGTYTPELKEDPHKKRLSKRQNLVQNTLMEPVQLCPNVRQYLVCLMMKLYSQ